MPELNVIDVADIISKYTIAEHAQRADAYFEALTPSHPIARKPWASVGEAPDIATGIGALLAGLELFHGARVIDFGCGTGWMGRLLSDLGCQVTSMDVSARALEVSAQIEAATAQEKGKIRYHLFDGESFGLPEGSFDRIACFSAFHHVPNPDRVLEEMHRVLAPGGIAAFHEPGPDHSRTDQSQFEMRQYDVIENDIVIERIHDHARRIGFSGMRLAFAPPRPVFLEVDEFTRFVDGRDETVSRRLLEVTRAQFANLRIFFLRKAGDARLDSRGAQGLHHRIEVASVSREGTVARVQARVRNSGGSTWLPSGHYIGAVNLGVQLIGADGARGLDYHRVHAFAEPVAPGEERVLDFEFPLANPGDSYLLDLVAEGVAWFSNYGAQPAQLTP